MMTSCRFRLLLLVFFTTTATHPVMAEQRPHYWFFFTDKGPSVLFKQDLETIERQLSERVKARRARVSSTTMLVDETDIPVFPTYVQELKGIGIFARTTSRWLNAISASATEEQLAAAQKLMCIKRIQPVMCYRRPLPQESETLLKIPALSLGDSLDYGLSFIQNNQIQIPQVHRRGYYGQGVRIGVFDTGFRLNHEAFDSLRIVDQYDFINNDNIVDNEPGDHYAQNNHGTWVLSILAGYAPGKLIGPAFRAEYLLAKTEDTGQEVRAEEDYWIAAAEWAEAKGVDVISTSLGYNDWYTYQEMNGKTAPITIAADLAVQKGIVVCASAGNENGSSWKYITAPADGKYVIAVGAVDSKGVITNFSSIGPTSDGRIKPDVVAMGQHVASVSVPPLDQKGTGYTYISGTSASCPLAAGAAALILCAHPDCNPLQLRDYLWQTSTKNANPDNVYGYGLIQTLAVLNSFQTVSPADSSRIEVHYTNPVNLSSGNLLIAQIYLPDQDFVTIKLFNLLGQECGIIWQQEMPGRVMKTVYLNEANSLLQKLGSGVYFIQLQADGKRNVQKVTFLH